MAAPPPVEATRDRAADPGGEGEVRYSDADYIAQRLTQLQTERIPLALHIGEHPSAYLSVVLAVDGKRRRLLLDPPNAARARDLVEQERRLHILAGGRGRGLAFDTELRETVDHGSGDAYLVAWPASLREIQRRGAFRVTIPRALGLAALIALDDGRLIEARVCDLSALGVCLELDRADLDLDVGQVMPACEIALFGGEHIRAAVELRRIDRDGDHHHARLGARFVDLSPPEARRLQRQIASLQRELIRLTPRV